MNQTEQLTPEQVEAQRQAEEMKSQLAQQAAASAAKEQVASAVKRELNRTVSQMLPDEANRLRWAGLKGIPVIGNIIDWSDRLFQIRRLFRH